MTLTQLLLLTTYGKSRQPLNTRQVLTLFLLAEHGKQNLRQIGRLLKCTPAGASRARQRLCIEGLVKRIPNQDDARDVFMDLTPKGEQLVKQLQV